MTIRSNHGVVRCLILAVCILGVWPAHAAASAAIPVVTLAPKPQELGHAAALIVIPADAQPIAEYAASELARHIELATGVALPVLKESSIPETARHRIYLGGTQAAVRAGIDVKALPSEAFVLRTVDGNLFIAAQDGPGQPLDMDNTFSGTLWGVYEVLERGLGVRWLWPGDLGVYVPKTRTLALGPYDEVITPRFVHRILRPSINPKHPPNGDLRLAFIEEERERYAHEQTVFLRRHRMGNSANTYFVERTAGSGHSFEGWWEKYGQDHPDWFQLNPDGHRGPADPSKPKKHSMCVSNPELHEKLVELWKEERAKHPGGPLNIGIGENDTSGACCCPNCLAWDGPPPDLNGLPPGLERSYTPTQASNRYARFLKAVQSLAAETDPGVKVHFYAFENYFWAPSQDITLNKNIVIGFVPWFRWAGWFPRTNEEHEWIKQQWLGWQRSGASVYYRPNWFLDGWSMPHIYPHQFADAFQFYAKNGMIGTDFDSLMGQWAAQGPNLYLLARIHVRPDAPVDALLDEFYSAFGPAEDTVREYFQYWEDYSIKNREKAADSIKTRREGKFRRYAMYALVAEELYPQEVFEPAREILDRAAAAAGTSPDSEYAQRVAFLREGLNHARLCVETAKAMNDPRADAAARSAVLHRLIDYRRNVGAQGIANLDRLSVIELESWKDVPGFAESATAHENK
ncbi:MAG: DUF4838 domain-containing protein [Candidatus Hydrogenedentes bacterium]|nr:DUF4838 domain-containing protein [Candidatus Hydrogenedentota bacterium]